MKEARITISLLFLASTLFATPSANAVENGSDAAGNSVVVPISVEISPGKFASCSGALLMQTVVITAGHCLIDSNGQTATNVKVGPPGSANIVNDATWAKATQSYFSLDYQGNGLNNSVGTGDIGVLTLDKLFTASRITIASENQLLTMKSTGAKLRLIGYGYTSDAGLTSSTPNSFEASYSNFVSSDPNQSFAESSDANPCAGDSGGPGLYTTPLRTMLVGVITGGYFSDKCSKKQGNGKYLTGFTIINRYANLPMAAAADALTVEIGVEGQLTSQINKLQNDAQTAKDEYAKLQTELDGVRAKLPKSITCLKGKQIKKVTAVNPTCPVGYKLKG